MGCTRVVERVCAATGHLQKAPTRFETSLDVCNGGVLWAVPALAANGLLKHTEALFSLPPGYYSVIHIFLLLAYMALCRIKTCEQLRYYPAGEGGKLLGLDRIPEVRTLREKIKHLAEPETVNQWSRTLSQEWMEANPERAGTLYVDGHVRVYHGSQTALPRRYVARDRLCMRGTTDYWVNDQQGDPFFVISTPFTSGLLDMLRRDIIPRLLQDVPNQPTEEELETNPHRHRFLLIFDREGYSPAFFAEMWEQRIACQTYHKYPKDDWPEAERFQQLAPTRKQFLDTIKMIAYRAETSMTMIVRIVMARLDDARSLIREIFSTEADLIPHEQERTLTVRLHHLTNHMSDQAARALAEELNATEHIGKS